MGWFKDVEKEKTIDERKRQVDRDVAQYRAERMLEIEKSILEEQRSAVLENWSNGQDSIKQRSKQEHEYHSGKEVKMTELAGIDAQIKAGRDVLHRAEKYEEAVFKAGEAQANASALEKVVASKDGTITLLNDLIKVIVGKLPKVELDKLGINVSVDATPKK